MRDGRRQTKRLRHVSLWARRDQHNELERAFSERWKKENDSRWPHLNDTLQKILTRPNKPFNRWSGNRPIAFWVCQRDATIVATVIQWLGTNCGFAFLRQCLKDAGYEVVETEKARELQAARWDRISQAMHPEPAPLPGYAQLVKQLTGPWLERLPFYGYQDVGTRSFAGKIVRRSRPWVPGRGRADDGWVFQFASPAAGDPDATECTAVQMARKLKLIEHARAASR